VNPQAMAALSRSRRNTNFVLSPADDRSGLVIAIGSAAKKKKCVGVVRKIKCWVCCVCCGILNMPNP
jgi:hypothetical protein